MAAHHGRKNEFQNFSFCTLSFGYKGSYISKEQDIWGGSLPGCGSFLQEMTLKLHFQTATEKATLIKKVIKSNNVTWVCGTFSHSSHSFSLTDYTEK